MRKLPPCAACDAGSPLLIGVQVAPVGEEVLAAPELHFIDITGAGEVANQPVHDRHGLGLGGHQRRRQHHEVVAGADQQAAPAGRQVHRPADRLILGSPSGVREVIAR